LRSVHHPRRAARTGLVAGLLCVALLVAACGDGSDDEAGPPTGSDLLGPLQKATGEPIKLGYVSTGRTPTLDSTDEIEAAKATAKYVNDHLGGIGGRPIELQVCETTLDPARGTDCGNQLVSAGVSAVLGAVPNGADQVLAITSKAKIPLVLHQIASQAVLTTPGASVMSNPLAPFGGPAAYAREKGYQRAAMVVLDVPAAIGPAKQLGGLLFGNAGASVDVIGVPPGTADMTAQLQAAQGKDPQLIHIIGDANFCTAAIKAIRTLGLKAEVTMFSSCVGGNPGSIPGGYAGVQVFTGAVLEGPESATFDAVLSAYGVSAPRNVRTAGGYQTVLGFARALQAAKTSDVSPAGIASALRTMPPTTYPLAGGATFQCDGKQIALAPNVCSTIGVIARSDAAGALSGYRVLDAKGIYAPSPAK
jgi:branched-chain amino acid transport system substrate-binding protein